MRQASLDRRVRERMFPALVGARVSCLTGWGDVVSVFSRAVNIRHTQGLLVSFIEETSSMTSLSICLPAFFRKQKKGLVPGDRVRFEGLKLVTRDFVVELPGRPTWQGTLTRDDINGFRASKVSLVKETLLLKGRDGGFLGLLRRDEAKNFFVDKAVKVLGRIQGAPSRDGGLKGISGLVGLGPGSTPSGDDFITGVLLGEETLRLLPSAEAKAVAGDQKNMVACSIEKEDIWSAMNRTNDAGRTLLWQALQGHFPDYLIEAVRSVSDAQGKEEIVIAVERAASLGATSGTDAMAGFLYFMEGRL